MIHRYLATGVGVLILTLTVTSWLERKRISVSPWWPTVTLAWVCLQGAFGALTVTMKLFPAIVTMHLLGGLILLALLRAQAARYAQAHGAGVTTLPIGLRLAVIAAFALLWAQIALSGWVSTNYAVLACTDFPACQNSLWPSMDFSQGFTLWRELGAGHDGANISFEALTAIHYVHRLMAYLVFAVLLALAFYLHRIPAFRMPARWLAGLILLQAVTGISNAVLGWPLLAAVMHTGGAAALVIVLSGVVFSSRSEPFAAHASKLTTDSP
jgi:cytochrome c oxidase assembly protein subunit 15